MSDSEESASKTEIESCLLSMRIGTEEGLKRCSSEVGRRRAVADIVGLRETDQPDDAEALLEGGVTDDVLASSLRQRQYVFGRVVADGLLETHDGDVYKAINAGWREIDDAEQRQKDGETDGEADSPAADTDGGGDEGDVSGVDADDEPIEANSD